MIKINFKIIDFHINFILRKTTFNYAFNKNNFDNLINNFYYFINYSFSLICRFNFMQYIFVLITK